MLADADAWKGWRSCLCAKTHGLHMSGQQTAGRKFRSVLVLDTSAILLVQVVLLPLLAGAAVSEAFPGAAARLRPLCTLCTAGLVALTCGTNVAASAQAVLRVGPTLLGAVLALHTGETGGGVSPYAAAGAVPGVDESCVGGSACCCFHGTTGHGPTELRVPLLQAAFCWATRCPRRQGCRSGPPAPTPCR